MNVLLVTQNFYPENFKSNDIAFDLVKKGHAVTVLTSIPNYPKGKFYDGYGIFKKRIEVFQGVKIYRTLVIPRGKAGALRLALNYFSWAVIASIWALFLGLFHKYDAIIVHEVSPITQGIPALIIKMLRRCPIYFWVLDLWPESLQAAGGINNKHILGFFSWIAKIMYKHSNKILISSRGFKTSIIAKGDFENKIVYFPNWAEDVFANPPELSETQSILLNDLPDGFRVMFTGNIGEAQDFTHVMEAAKLLQNNKGIKFILVGDGRRRQWILDYIQKNNLEETVFCPGRFPIGLMPAFCSKADLLFLSLKDDFIFSLTVPAKLQSYMAMKKPIIAMINGETQNIIKEANCGIAVNACDYRAFAESILRLSQSAELKKLGESGYDFYKNNFDKEVCINRLNSILLYSNS